MFQEMYVCVIERYLPNTNRMLVMTLFVPVYLHNSLTSELDEFEGKALVMSSHAIS